EIVYGREYIILIEEGESRQPGPAVERLLMAPVRVEDVDLAAVLRRDISVGRVRARSTEADAPDARRAAIAGIEDEHAAGWPLDERHHARDRRTDGGAAIAGVLRVAGAHATDRLELAARLDATERLAVVLREVERAVVGHPHHVNEPELH